MERVTTTQYHIGISLCGFIYSNVKGAYCSLLGDLGYKKRSSSMKERDNIIKSEKFAT